MIRPRVLHQPISYRFDLVAGEGPPRPLLVALHGYGQTKEDALRLARAIRPGGPVAALQAPHPHHIRTAAGLKTGFGWVSGTHPEEDILNHHRFVAHATQQAFAEGLSDAPRAFLFGFSQAVSLNYRFARAHPELLRGLVAVAGAVPTDWRAEEVRLEVPVLHVAPTEDEAYPLERARGFKAVLAASGADLTWLEVPGGHRVPRASFGAVRAWLEAHL